MRISWEAAAEAAAAAKRANEAALGEVAFQGPLNEEQIAMGVGKAEPPHEGALRRHARRAHAGTTGDKAIGRTAARRTGRTERFQMASEVLGFGPTNKPPMVSIGGDTYVTT